MKSFIPVEYQKLRKLFSRSDKFKIVAIFVMMLGSIFLEVIGVGIIPAFIAIVANPSMVLENKRFGWIFLPIRDYRCTFNVDFWCNSTYRDFLSKKHLSFTF